MDKLINLTDVEPMATFTKRFKDEFLTRYGIVPIVIYQTNQEPFSLKVLEQVINAELQKKYVLAKEGIRSKKRHRILVDHRHLFFMIARTLGYSYGYIGSFLTSDEGKFDHATVIHGERTLKRLLEIKDPVVVKMYTEITNELSNLEYARNLSNLEKRGDNTQSDISHV